MCHQGLGAPEGIVPGIGTDLGSILRDTFELDQTFSTEHSQHLRKQVIQGSFEASAEIRKRVMVDRLERAQPLKSWFVPTLPADLAGAANPAAIGIKPQSDQ